MKTIRKNTKKRSKGFRNGKRVVFKKSTNPEKKYMAIFYENGKKIKTTHFGAAGMSGEFIMGWVDYFAIIIFI